jgi:hypothetical protein
MYVLATLVVFVLGLSLLAVFAVTIALLPLKRSSH